MWQKAKQFVRNEEGATAVEYGLIAALVAAAIAVTVTTLGQKLVAAFNFIATKFTY